MIISEESMFLINNWAIIEKLERSIRILREELAVFLNSLEEDFIEREWWDDNLIFIRYQPTQIYISRKNWTVDDKSKIWIGIEKFTLESLFGNERPSQCYLWIHGAKWKEKISNDLVDIIKTDTSLKEYIDPSGGYVLTKPIKKITNVSDSQVVSNYIEKEIVDFIENIYLCIKDYEIDFNA